MTSFDPVYAVYAFTAIYFASSWAFFFLAGSKNLLSRRLFILMVLIPIVALMYVLISPKKTSNSEAIPIRYYAMYAVVIVLLGTVTRYTPSLLVGIF